MKLNDIRVATKLWGSILGLLVLMLGVFLFTQYRSGVATERAAAEVQRLEANIAAALRWEGLTETNTERSLVAISSSEESLEKFFSDRQVKGMVQISELQAQIEKMAVADVEKAALAKARAAREQLLQALNKLPEIKATGDRDESRHFAFRVFMPTSVVYIDALKEFVKVQEELRDQAKVEAERAHQHNMVLGLIGSLVVLVIGVLMASLLVRSITRPLDSALALANAIAQGDLTQQVQDSRQDEFGKLLKALSGMVHKLHGVVLEVRNGVNSVTTASEEIANGNQDLSARTEQTASNLEETAASMEELTAAVTQSADTARQANQLAANAAQAAERGGEVVGQVVHSMQQISDSSRKIADIIGVIDSIAFQTNILALNAAVEAARAGEQGRGFAVVAGEVRSLAQRSAEAAKEIKGLISASVGNVDAGSSQVSQAGAAMGEIVGSVRRVSDLIGEITASSTEQRDGIAQVNQAVMTLDQMTQQNAALVEESSAAASAMRDQAQHLAQVVSMFNVGAAASAVPAMADRAARRAPESLGTRTSAAPLGVGKAAAVGPQAVAKASAAAPRLAAGSGAASGAASAGASAAATPSASARHAAKPPAATTQSHIDDEWESF